MPTVPAEGNGWNEYKRLVLAELDRLDRAISALSAKHEDIAGAIHRSITQSRETIVAQLGTLSERVESRATETEARVTVLEVRLQRLEVDTKALVDQTNAVQSAKILSRGQIVAAVFGMVITALMSLGAILAQLWK